MQHSLIINRSFDAPKDIVFKYWSEPEYFKQWWGPQDFTCPVCEMDFKVWWTYLNCMRSPQWDNFWNTWKYTEIIPWERIANTDCFADENWNIVHSSHYGMAWDWPMELLVTTTFEELDWKTKVTIFQEWLPIEMHEDCKVWWNQSLDKLEKILSPND